MNRETKNTDQKISEAQNTKTKNTDQKISEAQDTKTKSTDNKDDTDTKNTDTDLRAAERDGTDRIWEKEYYDLLRAELERRKGKNVDITFREVRKNNGIFKNACTVISSRLMSIFLGSSANIIINSCYVFTVLIL